MRIRLSPSLVVSVLALFVAMGGVANATVDLPWNSVGKEQLKWGAVDSSKVENRSLKSIDFAQGQLPQGAQGPQGDRGSKGAKGDKGETGARGPAGADASASTGGYTLRDASGTALGSVIGATNNPYFTVLWNGGVYAYTNIGLAWTQETVRYPSADCSGQPVHVIGSLVPTETEIAAMQGQRRWVAGVLGSSGLAAFKATTTPVHVAHSSTVDTGGSGTCNDGGDVDTWAIVLESVPTPPNPVQQPLTIG